MRPHNPARMTEFELKLEIPPARRDAVQARVLALGAQPLRLRALYLDTPDRALARAAIALRLRQEDAAWVQTAKGPGASPLERLEHDAPVDTPAGDAPPQPDPSRHDGTPLGARIRAALQATPDGRLLPVFGTDVRRLHVLVDQDDARLELALDLGRIEAGGRSHAVCELEIERKQGPVARVIDQARHWVDGHGLWLSTISKAQRGRWLAEGGLGEGGVRRGATQPAADAAGLAACLGQLLAPVSLLAGSEGAATQWALAVQAATVVQDLLQRLPGAGPSDHAAAALIVRTGQAGEAAAWRCAPVQHALLDLLALQLRLAGG